MRRDETSGELPGQDSFLDIVANIVGILILLVMVVGLRAAQQGPVEEKPQAAAKDTEEKPAPPESLTGPEIASPEPPSEEAVTEEELESVACRALALRNEAVDKARKVAAAREEIVFRDAERVQLATVVAQVEEQIDQHRQSLGEQERRRFEVRSELGAAEHELEKLMQERVGLAEAPQTEVEELENLPTPLAATVNGDELEIRLSGGHAKIVPWDAIGEAAEREAKENLWRLDHRDAIRLKVEPIDGFRLEFEVLRYTFQGPDGMYAGMRIGRQVLLTESGSLGEPIDRALQPDSQLMTELTRRSIPRKPTITVWVYEDSFDEFRRLKTNLFDAGYAVAGRPLPQGVPIGRSPSGTKSAAQ